MASAVPFANLVGTSLPDTACSSPADPEFDDACAELIHTLQLQLGIGGMHCASCSTAVEKALR